RPGESDAEHRLRGWAPRPEALESLDALVFDIQDVGARFYTYSSTLGSAIRAAGEAGKRIVVLDRVNPIGDVFEGPVLSDPVSEIGFHPVPVRHGLTLGEFGLLVNRERRFGADLVVVKVENWHPGQWFDETGLPW